MKSSERYAFVSNGKRNQAGYLSSLYFKDI